MNKINFFINFFFIIAKEESVEIFGKCIKKLIFKYNPEDFKNPSIEKIWSEIEAAALDRLQVEEIVDSTLPDNDRIKSRAGEFLKKFAETVGLDDNSSFKQKRKVI